MGFLRRNKAEREERALDEVLNDPQVAAELEKYVRVIGANSPDDLDSEADKKSWRTIRAHVEAIEDAADHLVPQLIHLSPDEARAASLGSVPGYFALAGLVAHRVQVEHLRSADTTEFEALALAVETGPADESYHAVKARVVQEERARRGLPRGEVADADTARALATSQLIGMPVAGTDERTALQLDMFMHQLEDLIQDAR